ncbi:MAG: MBL fold metallo-hydrolase [Chromatiales bacterium]|nr:MBL fold metallo-hydrolase [Chromatiales bacterium]
MSVPDVIELDHQIACIDTGYGRPRLAACYLVESGNHAAFIDTGTAHSTAGLLGLLHERGISPEHVDYVIPTHVHLDHAGGAGSLMHYLPRAKLVIHPRGARHMIDPSALQTGATEVYGEERFHESFGELYPIAAERVIEAPDGFRLDLNGRQLEFLDSPGHARHHFCVYDSLSQGFFTGDTFGLSYREFDTEQGAFVFATTTPVQFEPDAWMNTLDRLMGYRPQRMYLTHFGEVIDVERLADDLRRSIETFAGIARDEARAGKDDLHGRIAAAMQDTLLQGLKQHGCRLSGETLRVLLEMDVELNTQGLLVWLQRLEKRK